MTLYNPARENTITVKTVSWFWVKNGKPVPQQNGTQPLKRMGQGCFCTTVRQQEVVLVEQKVLKRMETARKQLSEDPETKELWVEFPLSHQHELPGSFLFPASSLSRSIFLNYCYKYFLIIYWMEEKDLLYEEVHYCKLIEGHGNVRRECWATNLGGNQGPLKQAQSVNRQIFRHREHHKPIRSL